MTQRDPYLPAFGEPVDGWHRWFAWHPVDTADRGWQWLRPCWRRRIQRHSYLDGGRDFWFQYVVHAHRSNPGVDSRR